VATVSLEGPAELGGVGLACPVDRQSLTGANGALACPQGHVYPVVRGVAVLLRNDVTDSHPYFDESRQAAEAGTGGESSDAMAENSVDPFVQQEIVKTNGILYQDALGALRRYPIPNLPLPDGAGARLLDIGCNWGRWSVAASQRNYQAIGIDPGLAPVQAAYRVSRALRAPASFLVGDGRNLPFADGTFDVVYSYSVLQHFSKEDARQSIREAGRVTRPGGTVLIQLANLFGVRQLYNQARDILAREQGVFRVRRWTPRQMLSSFEELVGPARLTADGFFSLNAQATDLDLMRPLPKLVVRSSEVLKRLSRRFPPLAMAADSVFIQATRAG